MSQFVQGSLHAKGLRVGVVVSRFNWEVTEKLEVGAMKALKEMGAADHETRLIRVPGAVEIPLAAQILLESGSDAVVALGAVIRGETSHYDFVCSSVERGCSDLQLRYGKPVAFGVLTVENEEQALERAGGSHGNKGYEAAQVAVEMANLIRTVR